MPCSDRIFDDQLCQRPPRCFADKLPRRSENRKRHNSSTLRPQDAFFEGRPTSCNGRSHLFRVKFYRQ